MFFQFKNENFSRNIIVQQQKNGEKSHTHTHNYIDGSPKFGSNKLNSRLQMLSK